MQRAEHGGAGTREEPGTLTQGAPVFPGSSRRERHNAILGEKTGTSSLPVGESG